jgi:hypothetical protein
MISKKAPHHGDTACTAKVKSDNHGGHGERQKQRQVLFLFFSVLSVSSVVNTFALAFRRVRRVAVVQMRLWP